MSVVCKNGARECTGCMDCQTESYAVICPHCGHRLEPYERAYTINEDMIGCELCVETLLAREVQNERV